MSLKKDLKKLEKLYKTKHKAVVVKISRYLKKQKLTKGDLVFVYTMILVLFLTLSLVGVFSLDISNSVTIQRKKQSAGLDVSPRPVGKLRTIVLGTRSAKANKGSAKFKNPETLKVPILMYHRVNNTLISGDPAAASLTVPTVNFESQLMFLKSQGFESVSLERLYRAFYNNEALPPKPVILTFDDGYEDNYVYALPLLKKYNLTATFFISTGFSDQSPNYLTKSQIKEMSDLGMSIESHTINHPNLVAIPQNKLQVELSASKKTLEEITGRDVFFLAYPYGSYSAEVVTATKKAGYLMAVTINAGHIQSEAKPYELHRERMSPYTTIRGLSNFLY
jgi:peptidoglycan/xylan/chitin deacetylase (PgdA/CDA1 family)